MEQDTRKIARPANQFVNEETTELKTIEGVGFGFTDNTVPELIFTPHKDNTSSTVPNVSVSVLVDGSLSLRIIDDENSTKFNSTDSFTVSFSSVSPEWTLGKTSYTVKAMATCGRVQELLGVTIKVA